MSSTRLAGAITALLGLTGTPIALADSLDARCDIYPAGSDHTDLMIPCRFYQAQGHVVITRSDGVEHDLTPTDEGTGNFRDQDGRPVYRQSSLGDQGLIFRLPDESVYVYWNTDAIDPDQERPPHEPAVNLDFDATAWVRCRSVGDGEFGDCPSGALRMDGGQASVVIEDPPGKTFTINFMTDYVNAANRKVEATLEVNTWTVVVDGERVYQVPLVLIEGS
jgi:hypothetical protein